MNSKATIDSLLQLYETVLEGGKKLKDFDELRNYLYVRNVHYGVCNAALCNFGINILRASWMNRNIKPRGLYWGITPDGSISRVQCLYAIKLRITILKRERKLLISETDEKEGNNRESAASL